MYEQRRELGSDETKWRHRIMGGRRVARVDLVEDKLRVYLAKVHHDAVPEELGPEESGNAGTKMEALDVDLIISATGYVRDAHVDLLKDVWSLLPRKVDDSKQETAAPAKQRVRDSWEDSWEVKVPGKDDAEPSTRVLEVARDYSVRFTPGAVAPGSGIWLQGCCEGTHGVSARLPSVFHRTKIC